MRKKTITIAIFLIALFSIFYSCSDNIIEQNKHDSINVLEKNNITEELSELIDIREEITQMVIDKKINIDKLMKAYKTEDTLKIMEAMQMSKTEYSSYNIRLLKLNSKILKKYPAIKIKIEEMKNNICTTCNSDKFFENFEKYTFASKRKGSGLSKIFVTNGAEEVDCDWLQYFAGLAVCSTAGPVLYWPCAYLMICGYCSGGWVDDACM